MIQEHKRCFQDLVCHLFGVLRFERYPIASDIALKLPWPSTYLCEVAFSSMLVIITKDRNRLFVKPDPRCCLAVTEPRI